MSTRRELILHALQERFEELCARRIFELSPDRFRGMEQFVAEVRERFQNSLPTQVEKSLSGVHAPNTWVSADTDCLSSLAALSLGRPLRLHPEAHPQQHPPIELFLKALNEGRGDPHQSDCLLVDRYACPLNFNLAGEVAVREYVLLRIMVHARARIEKESVKGIDTDDLLLKLNLIALNASLTTDLRFLDALNYYYELLPADWQPGAQHNWLMVSYFALYAQALAAWLTRE
jgi:hypothetical protein